MNLLPPVRCVAVTTLALAASLAVSVPAHADPDPTVSVESGVVEYVDPALADADAERVTGTLRQAYVDVRDASGHGHADSVYAIETADGEHVPVSLDAEIPTAAANGQVDALVVDDGSASAQVAEATVEPAPATAQASAAGLAHQVFVAMPTDTGALPSDADVRSSVGAMNEEWSTEANGAIGSASISRIARYDSAYTKSQLCQFDSTSASVYDMWDEAARAVGWTDWNTPPRSSTIDHLVLVLSGSDSSCVSSGGGTLGIGVVGGGLDDSDGSALTVSWRGNTAIRESTLIHELGHNFGLDHANVRHSATAVKEYHDIYSVMGFGMDNHAAPALDSAFRDELGVTGPEEIVSLDVTGSTSRTVTLAPRGATSGTRGLKIVDRDGAIWWVDYRAVVGRDVGSLYANRSIDGRSFAEGVTVSRLDLGGWNGGSTDLVLQPASTSRASFAAGTTFTPTNEPFRMTVDSIGGSAVVTVSSGAPAPVSPPAAVPVTVSGTAKVGYSLTAAPAAEGYAYQWLRDGQAISGAVASTYAPTASDVKKKLSVRVSDGDGVVLGTSGSTVAVAAGTLDAPAPKVSGTVKRGRTLTASAAWGPRGVTYSYQWYAGSKAISKATRSTYKIASKYAGAKIRVKVTGRLSGYSTVSRYSAYTAKVRK